MPPVPLPRRGRLAFRRRFRALGIPLGGDRRLPRLGGRNAERFDGDGSRWPVERTDTPSGYVVPVHVIQRNPRADL